MRITQEQKRETHERIITTASELFRDRGFDGVGVADLMEKAGLTHGGFYNHFGSKNELIAKAVAQAFGEIAERYADCSATAAVELYISREHRDDRALGCPAAALSGDTTRQTDEARSAFAAGMDELIRGFEKDLSRSDPLSSSSRAQAISVLVQAVGAIALSRACPDDAPLADEILDACRASCLSITERGVSG